LYSRVVSVLDSGAEGPGISPTQTVHTHCASVHQAAKLVAALLRVAGVTAGLAESNGSFTVGFMTHVTCRLTANNRDQLRNPTLDNRVWATFTFFTSPLMKMHKLQSFSGSLECQTKKLCCRRRTARLDVSVRVLPTAAEQYV